MHAAWLEGAGVNPLDCLGSDLAEDAHAAWLEGAGVNPLDGLIPAPAEDAGHAPSRETTDDGDTPAIPMEYVSDADSENDVADLHLSAEAVQEAPAAWRLAAKRGDVGVRVAPAPVPPSPTPVLPTPPACPPATSTRRGASMWDLMHAA